MRNFTFVLWMLFFPVSVMINMYLSFLMGWLDTDISVYGKAFFGLIVLLVWISVGRLLYVTDQEHKWELETPPKS